MNLEGQLELPIESRKVAYSIVDRDEMMRSGSTGSANTTYLALAEPDL